MTTPETNAVRRESKPEEGTGASAATVQDLLAQARANRERAEATKRSIESDILAAARQLQRKLAGERANSSKSPSEITPSSIQDELDALAAQLEMPAQPAASETLEIAPPSVENWPDPAAIQPETPAPPAASDAAEITLPLVENGSDPAAIHLEIPVQPTDSETRDSPPPGPDPKTLYEFWYDTVTHSVPTARDSIAANDQELTTDGPDLGGDNSQTEHGDPEHAETEAEGPGPDTESAGPTLASQLETVEATESNQDAGKAAEAALELTKRLIQQEREVERSSASISEGTELKNKELQAQLEQARAIKAEAEVIRRKTLAESQCVKEELEQARTIRAEAEAYRKCVLAESQSQAKEIIRKGRLIAEKESAEIKQEAHRQVKQLLAKAEEIKAAALEELDAQKIYTEAARLEAESRQVLSLVFADLESLESPDSNNQHSSRSN